MDLSNLSKPQKTNLLICFIDIARFSAKSQNLSDSLLFFEYLNSFAKTIIQTIEGTSGLLKNCDKDAVSYYIFIDESMEREFRARTTSLCKKVRGSSN